MTQPVAAVARLQRVATMATMAGRLETFQKVLPTILAQVDHVFIYLDGYSAPPAFLHGVDRITVRHAEAVGDLHASSRFLCLQELTTPAVVIVADDDIIYPPDYVERLVGVLQQVEGRAVVGVHGRIFTPPHRSYVRDAITLHFARGMAQHRHVHELGTGTCAFVSSALDVDPRMWARNDMDDIIVGVEAQRRGLARIAVAREVGWLGSYAESQSDSLWAKTQTDDAEQSRRMRELLRLYA